MQTNQLPPVAKSVYLDCKKCGAPRYHRVLAHTSSRSAKTECEVCHSKKTYSLPSAVAKKRTLAGATGSKKPAARKGAASHRTEYDELLNSSGQKEAKNFSIRVQFDKGDAVDHPKFGRGFVLQSYPDKIEVIFSDEVRLLVHNRS